MPQPIDITGQRFGRLVAIRFLYVKNKRRIWEFQCDCGKILPVAIINVRHCGTISCGCYNLENAPFRRRHHGQSDLLIYRVWAAIVQRCTNPSAPAYEHYGGRGITVCERWKVFTNFIADMGFPPSSNLSIDRIDNDGPYSPENCRWATRAQQINNRRITRKVTYQGQTKALSEWARERNIHYDTLNSRLRNKWPLSQALGFEPRTKGRSGHD